MKSHHQSIYKAVTLLSFSILISACGIGIPGDQNTSGGGKNSVAARTVALEAGDSQCVNGGILVETGIDENGNGLLDANEVDESEKVCNGSSSVDGLNSLVALSQEPAGENCLGGGVKIESGLDSNRDSSLDADEVTDTEFLCNGGTRLSTREVISVNVGTRTVFVPEEYSTPVTTVSGDFRGQFLWAGTAAQVAGFVSDKPSFSGDTNAATYMSDIEVDISAIGAVTNISTTQLQTSIDTVVAQYQLTVQDPTTATDITAQILELIALNTENGSISNLPIAPASAETDTLFRCSITVQYYSETEILLFVSVTSDVNYASYSSIVVGLGDGTNVGNSGDTLAQETDSFTASEAADMGDFLFVVDNSRSMSQEQTAVSQAGQDFFDAITSTGADFQVGVITTDDMTIRGGAFTNDLTTFQTNIQAGISGSGTETGIWFAEQSLLSINEGDDEDGTVTSAGFPRTNTGTNDQASLSVIILSDEASQYTSRSGGVTFDPENNLFIDRGYRVYSIVNPNTESASQYEEIAAATGGSTASINDLNAFPAIMDLIAQNATGSASRYVLSQTPISGSIVVRVNGNEIPNNIENGWQYRASSNSIVFYGTGIPAAGAAIDVTYNRISSQSIANNIEATSVDGEITLNWQSIENASSYKVYWSTQSGVTPTVNDGEFTATSASFTHTGLTEGVEYFYVVTAIINEAESIPSAQITATASL